MYEAAVSRVLLTTVAVWTFWVTENLLTILRPELQFIKPVAHSLNKLHNPSFIY